MSNTNFSYKLQYMEGYVFGMSGPSLLLIVDISEDLHYEFYDQIIETAKKILPIKTEVSEPSSSNESFTSPLIKNLDKYFNLIIHHFDLPIFDQLKYVSLKKDLNKIVVIIPVYKNLQKPLTSILNLFLKEAQKNESNILDFEKTLEQIKQNLRLENIGTNTPRFMKAAHDLGLQYEPLLGGVIQFGQGINSQWLESSFTERSSQISAKLARNKIFTAQMLTQAGIPAPTHHLVKNLDEALTAAKKLGYPVVLKPFDRDGGVGVFSDLKNDTEIRDVFDETKKISENILVEKHIHGNDYRLTVHQGRLLWAIERVPAGVYGDGKSTLRKLIDIANSDKRRGSAKLSLLKKIEVDKELLGAIGSQNIDLDAIPEKGRFIKLARKANIGAGGFPVAVMDKVHQDNAELAIRAAQCLRLDLAGIDLIMPDISQSWREVGGAICEVNAQPQLGGITSAHCYGELLSEMIQDQGRIPIIWIQGSQTIVQFFEALMDMFKSHFTQVAYCKDGNGYLANQLFIKSDSTYQAATALIRHKTTECLLLFNNDISLLKNGFPFNSFDYFICSEEDFMSDQPQLRQLNLLMDKMVKNKVMIASSDKENKLNASNKIPGWATAVMSKEALLNKISETLKTKKN